MTLATIIEFLENMAHPSLQESYDNAGLLTGQPHMECTGIICSLDATEAVIDEAIHKNCNLVVTHHPIIFSGLKKINGNNYVERTIIKAIKNDIAIYAIHTNLDNLLTGVNAAIADRIGLKDRSILAPKNDQLEKLFFYVPEASAQKVMKALFDAGGGTIGNYSQCSFSVNGIGTFLPGAGSDPYSGTIGERHSAEELKVELLYPKNLRGQMVAALKANHPYEEVAYELISLNNQHPEIGSGIIGELEDAVEETVFLTRLKELFHLSIIKHTPLLGKSIKRVSICGGAGSFLTNQAINCKSDIYISSDFKYHEFFDAEGRILIADIGHYESEQFTIDLLHTKLLEKFPNFAVLKTGINTNPVHYFV